MSNEASLVSVSVQREPELVGQTVVFIGGSAGIGFATARRARAEGADVILTEAPAGVLGTARRRFLTRAWPYRTLPTKRGRPG